MREKYLGIMGMLLALMVLASGCVSSGGSSPTSTTSTQTLPFTKEQLESAVAEIRSYEYVMEVESYNETKLAATLYSKVSIDKEKAMKSSETRASKGGELVYVVYYYTTGKGFVTLTNRSGLVNWEFSCYGENEGPNMDSTLLDNLWKDFPLENATLRVEGDYYLLTANVTVVEENLGEKSYSGSVTVKLTKDLIPVEILQKAYYKRGDERWVDDVRIEIRNVNSAIVEPPEGLLKYLKGQGLELEDLLGKC